MRPSSRTPEGEPTTCPLCGKAVRMEFSLGSRDAPCPHCGNLLWFTGDPELQERAQPSRRGLAQLFAYGKKQAAAHAYDYATDLFATCMHHDPSDVEFSQAFLENLRSKFQHNGTGSKLAGIKTSSQRAKLHRAEQDWASACHAAIEILKQNPWDSDALVVLAGAAEARADRG